MEGIDPSEIGSDLPAFPFERMAFNTPFADKETGSFGRVLREKLTKGKRTYASDKED